MITNDGDIGKLIKTKRKELKLTLEQVAKYVGVGKSTVSKWERGAIQNMKKDKIDALSSILGIDPLVFIYGIDCNVQLEQVTPHEFKQEVISLLNKTTNLSDHEKSLLIQTLNVICSNTE